MGAYLSKPVTDKISCDENNDVVAYGASSMQGWRVYQEDAHNAILNFGKNQSLFAVYDGHGGHEVAAYTAAELPNFIKGTETYNKKQYLACLSEAFLEFDATLVEPEVLAILKDIAGSKDQEDSDYEGEEIDHLCREANMPLEEVMAKYTEDCSYLQSPMIMKPKKSVGCNSSSEEGCSSKLLLNESLDETDTSLDNTLNSSALSEEEKGTQLHCPGTSSTEPVPSSSLHNGNPPLEGPSTLLEQKQVADTSDTVNGEIETSEQNRINDEGGGVKEKRADLNEPLGEELVKEGINGPSEENTVHCSSEKENKKMDVDVNGKVQEKKDESCQLEKVKDVNGPSEETSFGGKGKGKGIGKGKSLLNHALVQAMKEVQRRAQKRKAAQKAEEIYKQIQLAQQYDLSDEDDDDEDEEEGDESFNGEICNHGIVDNSSSEEDDSEEEEEEEEEDEEEDEEEENELDDSQYHEFAMNMREEPGYDSGCTACVALLNGPELFVANVGDSRCVVSRSGKALDMSIDHKPEDEVETNRITSAGGRITSDGRVNGGLNLSRALGDHSYKQNKNLRPEEQMISPFPDVRSVTLTNEDSFIVIACDGIWNSMSSQEVCDFVTERLASNIKLSTIAEQIFDHCLSPDAHGDGTGCDNMTCIIIKLLNPSGSWGSVETASKTMCEASGATPDTESVKKCMPNVASSDSNMVKVSEENSKLSHKQECETEERDNIDESCEESAKEDRKLKACKNNSLENKQLCEASEDIPSQTEKLCEVSEHIVSETEKMCEASDYIASETENICEASEHIASETEKMCEATAQTGETKTISNTESSTTCGHSESISKEEMNEPIPSTESDSSHDKVVCNTIKEASEDTTKESQSVKRANEAPADEEGHEEKRCRHDID